MHTVGQGARSLTHSASVNANKKVFQFPVSWELVLTTCLTTFHQFNDTVRLTLTEKLTCLLEVC